MRCFRHRFGFWLCAGLLCAVVGCSDDGASADAGSDAGGQVTRDAGGIDARCVAICEKVDPLMCPDKPDCVGDCQGLIDADRCDQEVDDVISCSAVAPAGAFECTADGDATLMPGHCDAELTAMQACFGI